MATESTVATDNSAVVEEEVTATSSLSSMHSDEVRAAEAKRKEKAHRKISGNKINKSKRKKKKNDSCDGIESEIGNNSLSSLTERVLPDRPAREIARDTKRILEICYGGKKQGEEASVLVDNEVLTKLLPMEEGVDDGAIKTERKKKKKPTTNDTKKKSRPKSEDDVNNDAESKIEDSDESGGVTEREEHSQRVSRSGATKQRSRKKKKKSRKNSDSDSIVTRDAAGKVVRKHRKIKGRHRVVKKELIKNGKDAKMELPIISESHDEGDIDYDSEGDYDDETYALNISSSYENCENDHGECHFGGIINDCSSQTDRETQITSDEENNPEEEGICGERDVALDGATSQAVEQPLMPSLDTNATPDLSTINDSIEAVVEQGGERIIVDVIPAMAGTEIGANRTGTPRSVSSSDSTACTSTAEQDNRTRRKRVPFFGNNGKLICGGLLFVVVVAALTILVVYYVSIKERNNDNSTTFAPSFAPPLSKRPSLRPSLSPTSVPTSSPTTIYSTSSTSCQRPKENPGVQIQEAEYAPAHIGNASIGASKNGYCGEGYVTNLTRSGAGLEFLPFELHTTGYYRVAVRYNNADETEKSLDLQINTIEEGEFDLLPTGNESTWMVQGIDNILLREGKHVVRLSVQADDENAPSIDWLSLSFQESASRFDYLFDLLDLDANGTIQSESEILALEWMSIQDLTDWSPMTDQEIIERYAVVQVYFSTMGDAWLKNNQWLSEFHACSWYGIACSVDNLVTDLMLDYNGLNGTIPSDISLLENLILISVDTNSLRGKIPTQIGQLENLSTLFMQANFLTGSLPSEFGSLTNLNTLDLRANELNGPIREEMYSMHNLKSLALSSNNLGGTLSTNIGKLTSMLYLELQSDQLSGTIPSELGQLTLLSSLSLGYNKMSGSVPSELGLLKALSILDINSNQLTGMLPPELSLLEDIIIDYYGNNVIL
mmetsp:Transcript_19175/g.53419  ORF Transcript_19175/g.53419 Transcript_19175/m.53419 type:complete len:949 (+) Transcript_19175:141-2987(+)|eukprot:CAMPEP_0172363402 /NCGR_PEP_ID=MMETSP1060-20121228/6772_1 /TAXON_ID=37318 /ORGANISM="Pseudo-nitzschia pungens, Strain cf. cingulata" /LENGTH=948 /DNA_ID=CAMNT_0013086137 /DNA_START=77 /DNA_END=2923 /DNA_ORIENTATION=+